MPKPGRGAEVHAQHRVTAVGQPLVGRGVTVGIATPGAAVDQQHHRHRRGRHAVAVGIAARRQGQVAHQGEAVAALDLARVHRRQRGAGQRRAGVDPQLGLALGAVVQVVLGRGVGRDVQHHPMLVVEGARGDLDLAVAQRLEDLEVVGHRRVERGPLVAQVVGAGRLDHAADRMGEHAADVGARVLEHHLAFAAGGVDRVQAAGVALAAVEQVDGLAVGGEAEDLAGQRIALRHRRPRLPRLAVAHQPFVAALGRALRGVAQRVVVVEGEVGELVVLDQALLRAGLEVDLHQVEVLLVAVVDADHDLVGAPRRHRRDRGARAGRRQRLLLAAGQVDCEDLEVLVAAHVLGVQHVVAGIGEAETADAAQGVVGDRLGAVGRIGGRHVHVEHAIARRDVAQPLAVGADAAQGALGIAEQHAARDQRRGLGRDRRGGGSGGGRRCLGRLGAGSQQHGKREGARESDAHGGTSSGVSPLV